MLRHSLRAAGKLACISAAACAFGCTDVTRDDQGGGDPPEPQPLSAAHGIPHPTKGICHATGLPRMPFQFLAGTPAELEAKHRTHREDFFVSEPRCAVCGDALVEPGETCDPPSQCQTSCDDGDACTTDVRAGSPHSCNVRCLHRPISRCASGDGCCPPGCRAKGDSDCSATCGNGLVEPGETCDPPSSCRPDCDDGNSCTFDQMTGSAGDCNVSCGHSEITDCAGDDGCCPAGCDATRDSDCSPICGNGIIEPGETCDPASSCPSTCVGVDACTPSLLTGSPDTCNVTCTPYSISACTSGDGCCPAGCNGRNDSDCPAVCGNSVIEPGETCDPASSCPPSCDDGIACTLDSVSGDSNACNLLCSHNTITTCGPADGCCPPGCPSGTDVDCRCPDDDPLVRPRALTAGRNFACALLFNGTVRCWGDNANGQLGNGTTISSSVPVNVIGISTAKAVSAGAVHACALLTDGSIRCWGYNGSGQLGDGSFATRAAPVTVPGLSQARSVFSTYYSTCAILVAGSVTCWGDNSSGQLGDGTSNDSTTPIAVNGITDAVAVAGGALSTCALASDGTIQCWGANYKGTLGNGTFTASSTPVKVSDISAAVAIAAGDEFACALLENGTVKCWGYGSDGQIGVQTGVSQFGMTASPATVNVTQGSAISSSPTHSCAIVSGGAVACWGANRSGELGGPTPIVTYPWGTYRSPSTWPVHVAGIAQASAIGAGDGFSCAVTVNGLIQCWGSNGAGQLGNGTTVDSSAPVVVKLRGSCDELCPNNCDDYDRCTVDTCLAGFGCEHHIDRGLCWDGNPCTEDFCQPVGSSSYNCAHALIGNETSCQPEMAPDTSARCSTPGSCQDGVCKSSTSLVCATHECYAPGACNTSTGWCEWQPTSGQACGDRVCSSPGTCLSGQCHNNVARICDNRPDACHSGEYGCIASMACYGYAPYSDGTSCSNGNVCDGPETCQAGACISGDPPGDGASCGAGESCSNLICVPAGNLP